MNRILLRTYHFSGLLCILILPIGYYGNSTDSTRLMIGAYGGTGQVATVIRDCSGHALASEANAFHEASWSAQVIPRRGLPLVFGVRNGYYLINSHYPIRIIPSDPNAGPQYGNSATTSIRKWYFIPEISLETRKFGFGTGIIIGKVPFGYSDFSQDHTYDEILPFTGHLRIGDPDVSYFLISLGEENPILLDGLLNIGLGYRAGRTVQMYSGFSGLYYDRGGFLQKISIRAGRHAEIYGAVRIGGADGKFEGGASLGLVFLIGKRP
jgi:hypothetical protein